MIRRRTCFALLVTVSSLAACGGEPGAPDDDATEDELRTAREAKTPAGVGGAIGVQLLGERAWVARKGNVSRIRIGSEEPARVLDDVPELRDATFAMSTRAGNLFVAAAQRVDDTILLARDADTLESRGKARAPGTVRAVALEGRDAFLAHKHQNRTSVMKWSLEDGILRQTYAPPASCEVDDVLADARDLYVFELCATDVQVPGESTKRPAPRRVVRAVDRTTSRVRVLQEGDASSASFGRYYGVTQDADNLYYLGELRKESPVAQSSGAVLWKLAKRTGVGSKISTQEGYFGHTVKTQLQVDASRVYWVSGMPRVNDVHQITVCSSTKRGGAVTCGGSLAASSVDHRFLSTDLQPATDRGFLLGVVEKPFDGATGDTRVRVQRFSR